MEQANIFLRTTQYPHIFLTPQDKATIRVFGDEEGESELSQDIKIALLKLRTEIHDLFSELVIEEYFLEEVEIDPRSMFPLKKCRFYILKLRAIMVGAFDVCYSDKISIPNVHIHTAFHRLGIGTFLYTQFNEYVFNQEDTKGKLLQYSGLETEAGEALSGSLVKKGLAEYTYEEIELKKYVNGWIMNPPRI